MADCFIKSGLGWTPITEAEYEALPERSRGRRDKEVKGKTVKNCPCRKSITNPYVQVYDDYKHRLEHSQNITHEMVKGGKVNELAWKDAKKSHIHRAAIRKMVKAFLQDLYAAWRPLEGLDVRVPYQEEYLGHKHAA